MTVRLPAPRVGWLPEVARDRLAGHRTSRFEVVRSRPELSPPRVASDVGQQRGGASDGDGDTGHAERGCC
jgi:hypothetical protein